MAYIFDPIRKTYIDDEDQSLGNKLALSEDVEEIIKQIDDQFGLGTVFPASELPPKENPYKDFEDRNPISELPSDDKMAYVPGDSYTSQVQDEMYDHYKKYKLMRGNQPKGSQPTKAIPFKLFRELFFKENLAEGGMPRQNFYKGELVTEGPQTGMYKVKFPGLSYKAKEPAVKNFPDIYFGTQYGTEEYINQLIADREKLTQQNYKTKINPEKILGEKTLKALVDDTFAKGDFENFKIKLDPSKIAAAERKGKTRTDTGGKVPSQYLTKFNKAIEAGPGSDLFKELMNITGRTEQELLELDAKRPGGKVDPKLRSERALEYGGVDRRLTDEELKERGKLYVKTRAEKEAVGKKYASTEDLERFKIVNQQKKDLNKFFKNNPDAINNTDFGKNIKA